MSLRKNAPKPHFFHALQLHTFMHENNHADIIYWIRLGLLLVDLKVILKI